MNNCKVIILVCVFFVCNQCTGKTKSNQQQVADTATLSQYERLDNYLRSLSDTLSIKNYDVIIFISDGTGTCLSCMKSFSDFVCQQFLNEKRTLIILNAKGKGINISPFLSDTVKNVVTDYSNDFFRLKIASDRTSIIVLKENNIDGVYPINSETLSDKIALLARMKYSTKK